MHALRIHNFKLNDQNHNYVQVEEWNIRNQKIIEINNELSHQYLQYASYYPTDTDIQSKLTNINLQISAVNNTMTNTIKKPIFF